MRLVSGKAEEVAHYYWVSDSIGLSPDFPLRAVVVTNVALLVLMGLLSGRLIAGRLRARGMVDVSAPWIMATLLIVNPAAFRLFGYGLETGLYLTLIVALQLSLDDRRGWFTTGLPPRRSLLLLTEQRKASRPKLSSG